MFALPLSYREDKPSAYAVINRAASSPPAGLNDFSRPVIPLVALSVTLPNPSGIDNPIDCRMLSTHPTSCGREGGAAADLSLGVAQMLRSEKLDLEMRQPGIIARSIPAYHWFRGLLAFSCQATQVNDR